MLHSPSADPLPKKRATFSPGANFYIRYDLFAALLNFLGEVFYPRRRRTDFHEMMDASRSVRQVYPSVGISQTVTRLTLYNATYVGFARPCLLHCATLFNVHVWYFVFLFFLQTAAICESTFLVDSTDVNYWSIPLQRCSITP